MATAVEIGRLLIRLVGDGSQLKSTLASGKADTQAFGKTTDETTSRAGASWRGFGLAVVAAVGLTVRAMNDAKASMIELRDAAALTGESAVALDRLRSAARSLGIEFGSLTAAATSYQEALKAIARGDVTAATQVINQLGLSVRDANGNFLSFTDFLPQFAEAISKMGNGMQRAQAVTDLLSGSATKLIPLLTKGADGVKALTDAANVNSNQSQDLEEFTKNLELMSKAWVDLGIELTNIISGPAAASMKWLQDMIVMLKEIDQNIRNRQWRSKWEDSASAVNVLNKSLEDARARLQALNETTAKGHYNEQIEAQIKGVEEEINGLTSALQKAIAKKVELDEKFKDLKGGGDFETVVNFDTELPSPQFFDTVDLIKKDLDEVQDRLRGLPILMGEAFRLDSRPFEDAVDRINNAVANNVLTEQQAARMKRDLKRQEQNLILDTATMAGQALSAVFKKSKLAAAGTAIINTAVGITKAMELPPPFSWIQAALIAATGVAQLASINSASETGGGSVSAPAGGGGGSDSSSQQPQQPQSQTIFIEGFSDDQFVRGEAARRAMAEMVSLQRDGVKLVMGR